MNSNILNLHKTVDFHECGEKQFVNCTNNIREKQVMNPLNKIKKKLINLYRLYLTYTNMYHCKNWQKHPYSSHCIIGEFAHPKTLQIGVFSHNKI